MRSNKPNIYKITNNITGLIYVGQSSFLDSNYYGSGVEIKKAIKKFGKKNFKKEILEFCEEEDLDRLEEYYISLLECKKSGYNVCSGKSGILSGRKNLLAKQVYSYSLDGCFIEKFSGVKDRARELGVNPRALLRVLGGERFCYKQIIYSYEEKTKEQIMQMVNDHEKRMVENIKKKENKKIIIARKEDGSEIEFNNLTYFSKKYGVGRSEIRRCLSGKRNKANGFIFYYKDNGFFSVDIREKNCKKRYGKKYIGISPNNERFEFYNITSFAEKNNLNRRSINDCFLLNKKNYKGWQFWQE